MLETYLRELQTYLTQIKNIKLYSNIEKLILIIFLTHLICIVDKFIISNQINYILLYNVLHK